MKCARLCEEVMRITVVTDASVSSTLQVTCRDLNWGFYTFRLKLKYKRLLTFCFLFFNSSMTTS